MEASSTPDRQCPRARRSCRRCRERKIKCDRNTPCSNCVGIALGSGCSYPPGLGRAKKTPRKAVENGRLRDRLSRLEDVLQRVQDARKQAPGINDPSALTPNHASTPHEATRLLTDETNSFYVSNSLWTSLSNEVVELREILDSSDSASSGEEPDLHLANDRSPPAGANAAIFHLRSVSISLDVFRPQISHFGTLFAGFLENVAPLHRLFHLPTLIPQFWTAAVSTEARSPQDLDGQSLLFAICYVSAISLSDHACISFLGETKPQTLNRLRYGTEQAMARADLLNTQSMTLLQALTLYIYALRTQDDSRTAASLTALLVHLARSIGLHRDGTKFQLIPLDTELRRRLWAQICLLDERQSEYYGRESALDNNDSSLDTELPLHINDADLDKDTISKPQERVGLCDMSLCLIRCTALRAIRRINHPSVSLDERRKTFSNLESDLESRYLQYCDIRDPWQLYISVVAKVILARTKLAFLHYEDLRAREHDNPDQVQLQAMKDARFTQAIEVLRLSVQIHTSEALAKWRWHARSYIQWYTGAFVLSEICSRPSSPECDRAWEYMSIIFDRCSDKERKGVLWRPLKRLMARAYQVREQQRRTGQPGTADFNRDIEIPDGMWNDLDWSSTSLQTESVTGIPTPDPTADWLEFQDQDLFELTSEWSTR